MEILFGLFGVLIGGAINMYAQDVVDRRKRWAEMFAALRVVEAELTRGRVALSTTLDTGTWWTRANMSPGTTRWRSVEGALAANLADEPFDALLQAALGVEDIVRVAEAAVAEAGTHLLEQGLREFVQDSQAAVDTALAVTAVARAALPGAPPGWLPRRRQRRLGS